MERICQLSVEVVHVGKLQFCIRDDCLQDGILKESEEFAVDVGVIDVAQIEHPLNQCPCFYGIVGAHLLKSGEVAGCEIQALYSVITLNPDLKCIHLFLLKRLQLEIATR